MTDSALAQSPPARPTGWRLVLITISLMLAPLLQVFDTAVVSIALRQMQGSLSATQDQMSWVLTTYLIALAVMTPLWGALSIIFGRKPLLLFSIVGFVIFSILAGTSSTLAEILIYRFGQGVFGAALFPIALSALLSNYRREDYGIAMGFWGIGMMFGPVFGPTLGGYLTEYFSWRWVFYLNVPIGILAFTMMAFLIPRTHERPTRGKFNYFGFVMLSIAIASMQFILDRGERFEWFQSPTIIILSLLAFATLWMFLVNSLTTDNPFIDLSIFSDKNFLSGIILRVVFGVIMFGTLVLLPPFIQNIGGYSLIDSGWIMAPRGLGSMVSSLYVGYLIKRFDPRKLMVFGMLVTAWTMWELSRFTTDVDMNWMIFIVFIQGASFTFYLIPVNSIAFSTLRDDQRDAGTSFFALLNNLGRSMGIAFLASYLAYKTQANHAVLSQLINPFNDHLRHLGLPAPFDISDPRGLSLLNRIVRQQAELLAYIADFQFLCLLLLCCLPIVFLMRNPLARRKAA